MIGPEDDFDAIAEGKPTGEAAPPAGTRNVGGPDLRGNPAAFRFEEVGRYRGMIAAAMERAGWTFQTGKAAVLSRFFNMIGGVVSETGEEPEANQSPVGSGQRGLLDPSGVWWVRLVETIENWVSERNAIVGEDATAVTLQRLNVGRDITLPVTLASALTASLGSVQPDSSLVMTRPMVIDRARNYTFRVTYTPAVTGARLLIYPRVTQGEVPEAFQFVLAEGDALVQYVGPVDPPTYTQRGVGHYAKDPFYSHGSLAAATAYTEEFMIQATDRFPACRAIQFALRDTSIVTAGTVTIVGTQE